MLRDIGEFVWGLIPQKDDDVMKLYAWRWKSVLLGSICLALALYAAGLLPFVPPPYALASSMDGMKQEFQKQLDTTNKKLDMAQAQIDNVMALQKDGQIRQLNSDLIDARRYQCRSINSDDKSALPFWTNRLQSLKLSYFQLAGDPWPDLPCNSF